MFEKDKLVLAQAEFVDHAPYVSNYKFMKIFYRSLGKKQEDYMTIKDYIWRWDADWFWCSKVFGMQNKVLRFLLGRWLLKSKVYSKIMRIAKRNVIVKALLKWFEKPTESVIQDVAIPVENAPKFLDFFQQEIGIKPVWTCPTRSYRTDVQYGLFALNSDKLYVNFGFWDMVPSAHEPGHYNRLIEDKVLELGGYKSLYSNVFYDKDVFWQVYNKSLYENLKNKYDAKRRLGDLYEKCTEKS